MATAQLTRFQPKKPCHHKEAGVILHDHKQHSTISSACFFALKGYGFFVVVTATFGWSM
jgi:hypothetical protein